MLATSTTASPEDQIVPAAAVPYAQLTNAFAATAARADVAVNALDVRIAEFHVRIRVAGPRLSETLLAALEHLPRASGEEPDLRIDVMDGGETSSFTAKSKAGAGRLGILLKASDDGRFVGEIRDHTELWLNRRQNHIVGWFAGDELLNLDERARPFHKLLSCWLEARGVQFVHAGLITHAGRGLLFVGNGGAGKSTSSIACMRAGMGYLGDDFIGFSGSSGSYTGHGIYGTCLLDGHHIRRFPDLERISQAPHHAFEEKRVMYLHRDFGGRLACEIEIGALLLPRVVERRETRTRPASKGEALMAIAPTSVMFLARPSREAFARVSALVADRPCFWLELGSDVDRIPDAVAALAESL